ncbi:Zn-dependent exopeptidase [Coprinopsis marcescibilis]|uniref:Zn-dependent exopeptidase n=1 Tax=Coprinopsis marcescibilis TaxID=230819 RepID=A0A5C3L854_COPMA|nr:Zn-dependent exopeptidase [Coprinopsis marcescibilis]
MKGNIGLAEPKQQGSKRRAFVLLIMPVLALQALYYYYSHRRWFGIECGSALKPKDWDVETAFLAIPDEESAIRASRLYATRPHLAGSTGDLETAKEFLHLLQRELGIPQSSEPIYSAGSHASRDATLSITASKPKSQKPRAWIDTYYPVMNTPLDRYVQVVDEDDTVLLDLDLAEIADDTDPDAAKYSNAVPPFHGLSPSGNVTGKAFDGGHCTKKEFDQFSSKGLSLEGTVVLCKYGMNFRGLKVKAAQEAGAVGVLIYSDLNDDGTVTEKNGYLPYPHGPARNPTSVQRGSVQFISKYPGDPTTPGYPSYENSTRTEGSSIPSIPSLPLSWANAQLLLRTLSDGDQLAGKSIRLVNNVDTKVIPIWNTMGVIPGHIRNEVVVIGNHRDAWVLGATDPSSGTVSVHEVIRGFGHLLRQGWKPLRTIVIASWDAEEYGLIGSTEWGEDFPDWVNAHVVAYLNLDSSSAGSRLRPAGSPLLAHLIRDTATRIRHPTDANRTLWDARLDNGRLFGNLGHGKTLADIGDTNTALVSSIGVNPLGSGSDYTVFLQHLGVASTNGGFSSTLHDPVYHYHSVFDSERWQEKYGDPGFHRHVAIAKHIGLQALRISDSLILPFNATHYANELGIYLDNVKGLALDASLDLSFDDLKQSISALYNASIALDHNGSRAEKKLRKLLKKWKEQRNLLHDECFDDGVLPSTASEAFVFAIMSERTCSDSPHSFPFKKLMKIVAKIQKINRKLIAFERGFISKDGIKDREWYKHLGVAPGKWLGYGATTFPALTEAITLERNETLAKLEASRLRELLDGLTSVIAD